MAKRFTRLTAIFVTGIFFVLVAAGCTMQQTSVTEEQSANRSYMTQINQIMDELADKLQDFDDAVARGDLVGIRTQSDNALTTLDALSSLEAPEALTSIKDDYQNGVDDLREALNEYVNLYTEISSATDSQPFDYSTLDSRLQQIQDLYNTGMQSLESADQKATEME